MQSVKSGGGVSGMISGGGTDGKGGGLEEGEQGGGGVHGKGGGGVEGNNGGDGDDSLGKKSWKKVLKYRNIKL